MLSPLALAGCDTTGASAPTLGQASSSLQQTNGLQLNGLQLNGLQLNGLQLNGLQLNGLQLNGLQLNGLQLNGLQLNGLQLNGLYVNQAGLAGVGLDGLGMSEVGIEGYGVAGVVVAGIGLSKIGLDTIGAEGEGEGSFDDVSVNGFYLHGVGENGLTVAGQALRDVGLDGLSVNGHSGVRRGGAGGIGPVDFDAERESILATSLYHLAGCALEPGQSATIAMSSGALRTFSGVRGLAPEWQAGPLSDDGEARVRACLESSPEASFGLGLNQDQAASFDVLLTYLVECALYQDDSVTIYQGDGTAKDYHGSLGLAPSWGQEALSDADAAKVSACIGARSNGVGQTVSISLRHPELYTGPVERDVFSTHEGAFWGSLFADEPYISACTVEGGGLSGRICAESESCGFVVKGDCAEVCAAYDPLDGYSMCGDELAAEVVNTFLNLGSRVTFGARNTCIINDAGQLFCAGDNSHGQLADGGRDFSTAPVLIEELGADVAEVVMGSRHACARQHGGEMWCWGENERGQLGTGVVGKVSLPTPVAVDVATLSLGESHSCALKTDGSAHCWGSNEFGQLGTGGFEYSRAKPTPLSALRAGVARLAASTAAEHSCAVMSDGGVKCWGKNHRGQLGDGSESDRRRPVDVEFDRDGAEFGQVTDMCTAPDYSCARKADGTLWCWGDEHGRKPRQIADTVAPDGLSCGNTHACYVRQDSTVWCFGSNGQGQLGRGELGSAYQWPAQVPGVDAVRFVNAADTHTCATRVDGTLLCWGKDPGGKRSLFSAPLSHQPSVVELARPDAR
ncbi:MAG: hypothetical protein Tsb0020_09010 [Haliangiales bacterium]